MDFDLYNKQILRLAALIRRVGRLAAPDASATAHSRLCGSRIAIDLKLDGDVTTDDADQGAGILSDVFRDKMLPPPGLWVELEPFLPLADIRSRHGSALLPSQALQRATAKVSSARARERLTAVSFEQDLWT